MADINLKTVTALSSRDTVVNVILEYDDGGTLKLGKATIGAVLAGLTSAADHAALVARVAALETAVGSGSGETLPAITASPSSPTFVAGAAAGTSIATLSAVPSGATRTISGDGRVVLNSTKDALVVGLTASTAGSTVSVTVTDTKAGASNSPVSTTITISVTASGTVTRYLATNMAEATMPNTQPSGSGGNELTRVRTFYLPVAMDDLEFTFSNTTVNADGTVTGAPAFTAFGASLRLASSSAAPVQGSFSGSTEIALASGSQATCVFTGPFSAGVYEYRAYTKKTASDAFRGSYATASWYSGGGWLAGKHLTDATVDLGNTNAAPFTPIAIKGKPSSSAKPVSFLLYGDSIATGFYDSSNSADRNGDLGGFSKGITAAGAAHARFTTPSMSMRTAASTACRAALLAQLQAAKPDYILDEMGVNDFYQDAVSLADYQTRKNAFWDWCVANGYSGKVIATTVTPSNGTADAARQSANTWLLTKPHAALYAVWDVAAAMTGSTTGSAYTAGLSDDALHPNSTGHNTLKTFIQGKVAALASGGGTVVTPSKWSTTDKTALAVIGGTSNDKATIQGNGTDTQSYQYAVLETRVVGNADTVVGFNISGTFDGSDFALVFVRRSDYAQAGFADAVPNSFVIRITEGLAHVNGEEVGIWQGTGVDASKVLVPIKRSGGVNKVAYRFNTMDWMVNQPTVNIQTGAGMIDGPAEWGTDDICVMLLQIFVGPTNTEAAQVISTADGLAAAFPGVTLTGYTPIAGAGSSSGGDGGTSSSDTSGGTSYVTPSGAGDGADGAYTFGTTAIADPVASRSRLRVATTPLKAGSGATETFWAHDYFSVQGVNVNLMEDVNRQRINFVTGFLKHLRPALIRVALTSTDTNIINMYKALCDAVGCKMVFQGMSFNDYSESTMAQKAAACVARVKALGGSEYIAWLEGMNEVDLNLWRFGAANNATAISMMVDMHTKCYDALKADAATSGILIAAPSCTGTNGQISTDVNTAIKGMSSKYDAGNARWYSGKWEPNMPAGGVDGNGYGTVEYELAKARATANGKVPVVITECGYHNAIQNVTLDYPHLPVREDTASLYMPDVFTRPYSQGARVVTNYQVTDFSSGTQTDKANDQENFGYLRYGARTVKPAGITMARFNAKLRDDATAPAMVAIPAYTLTGVSNLVRYNFQKSNGQYIIVLKDGRRAVDVDTEKWSGSTRTAPFNPNALLIYPGITGNIKFTSKDWSKVEWYNVHLDTTVVLTKKGDGSYDLPMSQKTGMLILTP